VVGIPLASKSVVIEVYHRVFIFVSTSVDTKYSAVVISSPRTLVMHAANNEISRGYSLVMGRMAKAQNVIFGHNDARNGWLKDD
jgi:hypothetical protein